MFMDSLCLFDNDALMLTYMFCKYYLESSRIASIYDIFFFPEAKANSTYSI